MIPKTPGNCWQNLEKITLKEFTEKHRDKSLHSLILRQHVCIVTVRQTIYLCVVLEISSCSASHDTIKTISSLVLGSFLYGPGSFQIGAGPGFGLQLLLLELGGPASLDTLTPQKVGMLGILPFLSGKSEDLAIQPTMGRIMTML